MVMADRIEPRTLFSPDDVANYIGAGYFIWETADANANLLELLFPEGGAVDVPAFVIGDASIAGIDLGASGIDLSGLTEPSLVIVNYAKDAYVRLDAGDDAVAGSQGLYFHPAIDEDVELINIAVTGAPRLYWNEADDRITCSVGIGSLYYFLDDDYLILFGASDDSQMLYETADANAKMMQMTLPHVDEDANNVAVLALLDRDAYGSDLGAIGIDLSGKTEPTLVIANEATDAYVSLDAGDGNVAQSKGLYFHPAADEDVEIINVGVTGTPRVYWDETYNVFHSTVGFKFDSTFTLIDGQSVALGNSNDVRVTYSTADADAKCLIFTIDESTDAGNNVPAFVFGEYDNLYNVNLGLFDTVTEPIVTVVDLDADSYIGISFGSDDVPEIRIGGAADFGNSTKDPRAVLPDDWARFNIGGVAYYAPLYLV